MRRQADAAEGQPVKWYCSEPRAVDAFKSIAAEEEVADKIQFEYQEPIEFVPVE